MGVCLQNYSMQREFVFLIDSPSGSNGTRHDWNFVALWFHQRRGWWAPYLHLCTLWTCGANDGLAILSSFWQVCGQFGAYQGKKNLDTIGESFPSLHLEWKDMKVLTRQDWYMNWMVAARTTKSSPGEIRLTSAWNYLSPHLTWGTPHQIQISESDVSRRYSKRDT